MRPWLIVLGPTLALIGLQAAQAQVTIDITKITCSEFLDGQRIDTRRVAIWLNGYVNGARGKTLIDPFSAGQNGLIRYCETHTPDTLVLDAARNVAGADK